MALKTKDNIVVSKGLYPTPLRIGVKYNIYEYFLVSNLIVRKYGQVIRGKKKSRKMPFFSVPGFNIVGGSGCDQKKILYGYFVIIFIRASEYATGHRYS